jgi:hypothetical protein
MMDNLKSEFLNMPRLFMHCPVFVGQRNLLMELHEHKHPQKYVRQPDLTSQYSLTKTPVRNFGRTQPSSENFYVPMCWPVNTITVMEKIADKLEVCFL